MLRRAAAAAMSASARRVESTRLFALSRARSTDAPKDGNADTEQKRAQAEAEAARKVRAGSSPLFYWTEVDVSNADRHIPRWQNALFVGVVAVTFAWFGNKMYASESERRRRAEDARSEMERRARAAVRSVSIETEGGMRNVRFADEEDAFEGLTPAEIEALVESERSARALDDNI